MSATRLYRQFNNREPSAVSQKSISISRNLVDLGRCIAVAYASRKEGTLKHYEHRFKSARLYSTDNGRTLIITGSALKVTDWIRG